MTMQVRKVLKTSMVVQLRELLYFELKIELQGRQKR